MSESPNDVADTSTSERPDNADNPTNEPSDYNIKYTIEPSDNTVNSTNESFDHTVNSTNELSENECNFVIEPFCDTVDSVLSFDNDEELDQMANFVLDDVVDDAILGLCFEVHRGFKLGILFLDETDEDDGKQYEIVDQPGLDVFGLVPTKKQLECVCPSCRRNMAASRFAPHLEKCMGMGRNSSRIANRRIANSGKDAGSDDDENDDDWTYNSDKKATKKKRDKSCNSPRRSKLSKLKSDSSNVGGSTPESGNSFGNFDAMTADEKKVLLAQMCGVISEHTKKMCTRSHRCPQHTDEQRKALRVFMLGQIEK